MHKNNLRKVLGFLMLKLAVRVVNTEIQRVRVRNHICISENTKQYKTSYFFTDTEQVS